MYVSTISNNTGLKKGGAMLIQSLNYNYIILTNITFSNNKAFYGGVFNLNT